MFDGSCRRPLPNCTHVSCARSNPVSEIWSSSGRAVVWARAWLRYGLYETEPNFWWLWRASTVCHIAHPHNLCDAHKLFRQKLLVCFACCLVSCVYVWMSNQPVMRPERTKSAWSGWWHYVFFCFVSCARSFIFSLYLGGFICLLGGRQRQNTEHKPSCAERLHDDHHWLCWTVELRANHSGGCVKEFSAQMSCDCQHSFLAFN